MGLIDTHTHLEGFAQRGELPAMLARARAAGVEAMIAIGTDTDDWPLYRDMANVHGGYVHHTVGLHPCSVAEDWAERVALLADFWGGRGLPSHEERNTGNPVALGECGLDRFHLPKDDPTAAERIFGWQKAALATQLDLAKSLGCPVVVHSRGAFRECVELIDASGVDWTRVVFHCFTEGEAEMAELVRRGGFGSFTGIVTYKSAGPMRAAAKLQGLDRLMVETDAPYLSPVPHRGKPNEPAYVWHTAEYLAREVFGVTAETLAAVTTANAKRFFSI